MAQLRRDYKKFKERDTEVIAVGPDSKNDFEKFWDHKNMPFIGLADPEHHIARLYDQEVNLFKFGRVPLQILIDKEGIVRYVHYSKSMADIPDNGEILERISEINA